MKALFTAVLLASFSCSLLADASAETEVAASRSESNAPMGNGINTAPQTTATELWRYKVQVYRAVGSRWYAKARGSLLQVLPLGTVHITYTIFSDGHLEIKSDPDANNSTLMLLHSVSLNCMKEASPFPPFSDAMKKEVGRSFSDMFSFSIRK